MIHGNEIHRRGRKGSRFHESGISSRRSDQIAIQSVGIGIRPRSGDDPVLVAAVRSHTARRHQGGYLKRWRRTDRLPRTRGHLRRIISIVIVGPTAASDIQVTITGIGQTPSGSDRPGHGAQCRPGSSDLEATRIRCSSGPSDVHISSLIYDLRSIANISATGTRRHRRHHRPPRSTYTLSIIAPPDQSTPLCQIDISTPVIRHRRSGRHLSRRTIGSDFGPRIGRDIVRKEVRCKTGPRRTERSWNIVDLSFRLIKEDTRSGRRTHRQPRELRECSGRHIVFPERIIRTTADNIQIRRIVRSHECPGRVRNE